MILNRTNDHDERTTRYHTLADTMFFPDLNDSGLDTVSCASVPLRAGHVIGRSPSGKRTSKYSQQTTISSGQGYSKLLLQATMWF